MLRRVRPWLILVSLWAVYFHPLILHPSHTLYSDYSDFLSEHLPGRIFLVHEWREHGELPRWNPYHFCGAPFIHDIQVGAFYPPYTVTLLFDESRAGCVMSWVIALHVLLAAGLMYRYARSHEFGEAGSLTAAIGFAFSAKWLTHLLLAGHTITVGLAWLPLVLLSLEETIRTGRVRPVLVGGIAFALLVLGTHPQWTFYSGLFIAAWTVPPRRLWGRWLLGGIAVALIGSLLAAAQLLPTGEASRYSARTVGLASSFSLPAAFFSLVAVVGPSATYNPPLSWEFRSLFTVFGLALALAAPAIAGPAWRTRRAILFLLLLFSYGGATLLESLPGFNLFRSAPRMLLVAQFPVAFLAGAAIDGLSRSRWEASKVESLRRWLLLFTAFAALPSISLALILVGPDRSRVWGEFLLYGFALALGLCAAFTAIRTPGADPSRRTLVLLVAALSELLAPTFRFPQVKPQAEIYPDSPITQFLHIHAPPAEARVIDIEQGMLPTDRIAPLGIGTPLALTHRIAMPRGYNPLDVRYYREYVNFVMGKDDPVLSLNLVAQPIVPNFPRTEPALFDLMSIRYLVCFEDYAIGPEYPKDPDHRLTEDRWQFAAQFKDPPAVPALPPDRPDPLPRVLVMENKRWGDNPRAFVVPTAKPMPEGGELAALRTTDLHQTVLVNNGDALPSGAGNFRPARIAEYHPNRVAIDLAGGPGGYLFLADVWFPGWVCRVDGNEVPVYRANHVFRAVPIPAGAKEAVFSFEPKSYRLGWWISAVSLGLVAIALAASLVVRASSRIHQSE
jgi:hypothetical protein